MLWPIAYRKAGTDHIMISLKEKDFRIEGSFRT